jgi:hypothetical protein
MEQRFAYPAVQEVRRSAAGQPELNAAPRAGRELRTEGYTAGPRAGLASSDAKPLLPSPRPVLMRWPVQRA